MINNPRNAGDISAIPADRYLTLWQSGGAAPNLQRFLAEHPVRSTQELAEVLLVDQARRWERGRAPWAEEYLRAFPAVSEDRELRIDVVYGEYRARCPQGDPTVAAEMVERFPAIRPELQAQFEFVALLNACEETGLGTINRPIATSAAAVVPANEPASGPGDCAAPLPFCDYRLEERLGAGAMGQVYRACQVSLNRAVAVKLLDPAGQHSPSLIDRFLCEARSIANLRHPNIVQVHGVGRTEDRGYFIAMDLVDGVDLESRLADGPLPISEAVRIAIEVARALDHAHARGIVHRDLKPSNVMVDVSGRVLVMDFGLAKRLEGPDAGMSAPGDIIGTPQYMAPEQADSRWGEIGPRSDIYGLGGLMYALLTGKPPVQGNTRIEILCRVASGGETQPVRKLRPEVPVSLEAVCAKCLHKQPSDRFVSAREVEDALRAWEDAAPAARPFALSSDSSEANCPRSRSAFLDRLARRSFRRLALGAVIAPLLVVGLLVRRPWSPTASDMRPNATEVVQDQSRTPPAETAPITVDWAVDVFRAKQRKNHHRITQTPAAVYTGDSLRIALKFSQATYPYVYWISADGLMSTLYSSGENPAARRTEIAIPPSPDEGLPVFGPTGTEVCVVVCRDWPQARSSLVLTGLRPQLGFPPLRDEVLLFRCGQVDRIQRPDRTAPPTDSLAADSLAADSLAAGNPAWHRLQGHARTVGQAEVLLEDDAVGAIRQWLADVPSDIGHIECLAVTHRAPAVTRGKSLGDEQASFEK